MVRLTTEKKNVEFLILEFSIDDPFPTKAAAVIFVRLDENTSEELTKETIPLLKTKVELSTTDRCTTETLLVEFTTVLLWITL